MDNVELFCWDHNCDVPEYPLEVFADADARRYLSGSAWHLYGGDMEAMDGNAESGNKPCNTELLGSVG